MRAIFLAVKCSVNGLLEGRNEEIVSHQIGYHDPTLDQRVGIPFKRLLYNFYVFLFLYCLISFIDSSQDILFVQSPFSFFFIKTS